MLSHWGLLKQISWPLVETLIEFPPWAFPNHAYPSHLHRVASHFGCCFPEAALMDVSNDWNLCGRNEDVEDTWLDNCYPEVRCLHDGIISPENLIGPMWVGTLITPFSLGMGEERR